MATVGRLSVDLDLNHHQLKKKLEESQAKSKRVLDRMDKNFAKFAEDVKKSLTKVTKKLGKMTASVASVAKAIATKLATAGVALVASLTAVITVTLKSIDQQERLAKSLGITGDELREMTYAAEQFGLEQDRVVDGMKELNLKITEYLELGSGTGVDFFARAGVNVKEFIGLNPAQQLERFADVISRLPKDEIRFFADELGSDALYEMIPLLEQGSGHIKELRKEARLLGLNLGDGATQATVAMQSIRRVGTSLKGITYQAATALAPALAAVFDTIIEKIKQYAKSVGGFDKLGKIIANSVISAMSGTLRAMDKMYRGAMANLRALARTYNNLPFVDDKDRIKLEDSAPKESEKLVALREQQNKANAELQKLMEANAATRGQSVQYYLPLIEEKNKELHALQEQIRTEIQRPPMSALDQLADEIDALKPEILAKSDEIMDGILTSENKGTTKLTQQFKAYKDKQKELLQDYESFKRGMQIHSYELDDQYLDAELLREQEAHQARIDELKRFLDEKIVTQEEYKLKEQELERIHQDQMALIREDAAEREKALREQVQGDLYAAMQTGEWDKVKMSEVTQEDMKQATIKGGKQVLGELAKQNKKAFELNKAMNIAEAIMNTATGVSKALAQGGIWGIPMAAMIGAMGAIQIATISSQQYQGQAHAGIDKIPGSGDQTWNLKGGERVIQPRANMDLTNYLKNQQNKPAGGDTKVDVNLTVQGSIIDTGALDQLLMDRKETIVSAVQEAHFYAGM